jgi:hypothetical protein
VIHDERVERADRLARGRDDARGRVGVGEVGLDIRLEIVCTPRLRSVMRRPAVREDARPAATQPFGDRETDADAAADAGDESALQLSS